MTSYPSSKNLITGKAALSESEDEDNSYDPESSIEPNHVEILMSFKKRYTNKHFSYIRTLVCKLINGETFTTLAQKRQNAEYFYRIDDISLGRAKYAIPVVNEKILANSQVLNIPIQQILVKEFLRRQKKMWLL
ncbi:hypothetical protein FDP41_006984 [Naegleria fowleri]|uniref:Uncharacterized protein n=1 Tax=Naegleria fowleri TaxID=5763 RepID=A0A6A5BHS6_NAEFO|nr:uncharacterized protein FDP41_006984 [Naegleria fowleri]KAF0974001.1 hypothetical protein FDP41_006984 [Naegleria fowleri]